MTGMSELREDYIDEVIKEWNIELPNLDTAGLSVGGRILILSKYIEQRVDRCLAPYGIQIWGYDVLVSLRRAGEPFTQTPTKLMRNCFLTSGAVTNRVNRLEASGLVVRSHDTVDRRSVNVTLTDKGRALVDESIVARVDDMSEVFSIYSEKEREALAKSLRKLLLKFEDINEESAPKSAR